MHTAHCNNDQRSPTYSSESSASPQPSNVSSQHWNTNSNITQTHKNKDNNNNKTGNSYKVLFSNPSKAHCTVQTTRDKKHILHTFQHTEP